VLSHALDKVLETMELEVGAIHLLDEQGGTLDLKVHRGVDLSPQIAERISRVKLAESPLVQVIATGEPLIVEDVSASPIVELIGRKDLKSVAVIPLKSKSRVLGTMEVLSLDSRQFTSEGQQCSCDQPRQHQQPQSTPGPTGFLAQQVIEHIQADDHPSHDQ